MNLFVCPLDSDKVTLEEVGGKGVNLSRLARAGFPVPPGFLITTDAYRAFVQANGLQNQIVEIANSQTDTSETRSAAIRRLFANGSCLPADLTEAIHRAYAGLTQVVGDCPLAVRSSATAEDLPDASFAGQQDTYLNVRGELAMLDAVKRCWASLWTARAIEYRARQGIDPAAVSLAVVVQVLVPAEASGILFTANPLSGSREEMVVDAAWGLGEAIVGGLTTPDHLVVDKTTGAIQQIAIGDKTAMTVLTETGTEECEVEERKRHAQVLTAPQLTELAKLGVEIESDYGAPQDIEWCFAQGKFAIVQARPITALPDPVNWKSQFVDTKWLKDMQAGEWATEPLSPLGATTTFEAMGFARQHEFPLQKQPWHTLINGWLYIRADYQARWQLHLVKLILWYGIAGILNGHQRVRRLWPPQIAALDSLEKTELANLSDQALRARLDRLLDLLGWWWWEVSWGPGVMQHVLLSEPMVRKSLPHLSNFAVLFRGNDSLMLEAERALRLAARSGDPSAYLARFGHFVESADPLFPTLREVPDLLRQHLAAVGRSEITPDERLATIRRERQGAEDLLRSLGGLRGFLLRWLIKLGQSYAAHTDDAVFHLQRVLALVRYTLLEIGRRMAERNGIEKPEDVFYIERAELWQTRSDLRELVIKRRSLRENQKRLVPPPYVPTLSEPTWTEDPTWKSMAAMFGETVLKRGVQERNGKKAIVGTPGSPGRARGIARVITGPDDFHRFEPGDVLVAHATTPVWTPLFNLASAAVTEVGGPFCHAAIVAREFGIPLVDGALDAMRAISDGMPVTVDGSAGVVYLEEDHRSEGQPVHVHRGHETV